MVGKKPLTRSASMRETYGGKIFTAGLNCLDEEATGGRVPVNSTNEILHGRLVGQTDEVLDMIHDEPR